VAAAGVHDHYDRVFFYGHGSQGLLQDGWFLGEINFSSTYKYLSVTMKSQHDDMTASFVKRLNLNQLFEL
jgi:hypothetical protein